MNARESGWTRLFLAAALAGGLWGCAGGSASEGEFAGLDRADRFAARGQDRRIGTASESPPVMVDGEPLTWDELRAPLGEAAGGMVVDEITLERRLAAEMTRRGLAVGPDDLNEERRLLAEVLAPDGAVEGTEQLIAQVRARRGLGPKRFASLLHRNAMLRALVRDRVEVRPDQVELAWRVRHGEKLRVRIIVTAGEREAQQVRQEATTGDPAQTEARFIRLAEEHSTDASAARGGLVEPFSPDDPAYEGAIRGAADQLQPGQIGPIIAIRNGFAVVFLDDRIPADGVTLAEASPALTRQLRFRQERVLMDELAAELLAGARVTTFDDALGWSRESSVRR